MRSSIRCLVSAAVVAVAACGGGERTSQPEPEASAVAEETHAEEENAIHLSEDMVRDLRISTAAVTARAGAQEVGALGEVAADQTRYAEVASPTDAQVVRVLVDANAPVARGTALAQLRSTDLGRARADLVSAHARRDLAEQSLNRKRSLADERIVAQREVEEAEAVFRAADSELQAATAGLEALGVGEESAEGDSSLFVLRSPIAGRVLDRQVVMGQFADPGTTLFTLGDLSTVWVIAQLFERDAVNVQAGSAAHVTLAALPGRQFDGRVTQVGRLVDAGSRTVPVRIELKNADGILRPGMSASVAVEVTGGSREILAVPSAALQRVGQQWLAFIPRSAEEFEMRPVGRGRDLGNEVEVISGLEAGETVVVEGAFLLKAEAEKRAGGGEEHEH